MKRIYEKFAQYYDIIFVEKQYDKECDFLEAVFKKYGQGKIRKIIDIGSGTGGHSLLLASRGYHVVGVDNSPAMVKIARDKAKKMQLNTRFEVQDMRHLSWKDKFDAAICMFGSLGYLLTAHDIGVALSRIDDVLKNGGLYLFDFWSGAVASKKWDGTPVSDWIIQEREGKKGIRLSRSVFDPSKQTYESIYHFIILENGKAIDEFEEKHTQRVFYLPEVEHFLEENGYQLLKFCQLSNLEKVPDAETHQIVAISRVARQSSK